MATNSNVTGKISNTCHLTSSLLQYVLKMSASSTNVDATPLAYSTFNNRVTQSGPLAVDASFQFVDVRDRLR